MKTSTTISILFWLKLTKAINGVALLCARITINGRSADPILIDTRF